MVVGTAGAASAQADVLRVPAEHATIQLAVDAAEHGDRIVVRAGTWCGATITKEVHLVGVGATIVGCDAPALGGGLRIGFFLPARRPRAPASAGSRSTARASAPARSTRSRSRCSRATPTTWW